ncbi:MAG: NlpC/P60 family protein [Sphingobacteriales bacterium]|nr:MAG: NlpC/P60 family protein [Sphingobacteriales bacterium]
MPKYFSVTLYMGLLMMMLLITSCGSTRKGNKSAEENKYIENRKKDKALIEKYEKLIETKIDAEKDLELFRSVDNWLGVPYKYAGSNSNGTDCSGLAYNLYLEVYNLKLPRSSDEQYQIINKLKQKNLEAGNLVFFKTEKGKKVSHVGVYLGNNKFIHSSTSKGVRIDDLRDKYYVETYVGGGKPKL